MTNDKVGIFECESVYPKSFRCLCLRIEKEIANLHIDFTNVTVVFE